MSFHFSKSKFVSSCIRCNKYAWLDKYMPEEKSPVDDFAKSLFDNVHKVGELAKEYFKAEVDVTSYKEDGRLDLNKMIKETENHIKLGTKVITEASFSFGGFFCSVDILLRNDGTFNMYEVKSSKQDTKKDKKLGCVKEKYIVDAAYQQYVLKNCGVDVNKVCVVLLAEDYVRNGNFELDKYFVVCDVTKHTNARLLINSPSLESYFQTQANRQLLFLKIAISAIIGSVVVATSQHPLRLMFTILILQKNVTLIIVVFLSLIFRVTHLN